MKIICISVEHKEESFLGVDCSLLELNKQYDGIYRKHDYYYGFKGYIIPSIVKYGFGQWFPEECFITLAEWRDKQINEILYE
jgi:hypothetical protein